MGDKNKEEQKRQAISPNCTKLQNPYLQALII
jgi:hypothetical protein